MVKHYVDMVGVNVIVDCGANITGATDTKLKVEKPDGTEVEWPATIYNENFLKYVSVADDFDQEGEYRIQAFITLGDFIGPGDTDLVTIYAEYQ
jgi:hypothetical protein